jgi:regulation of enolase protein 1 (concanavalin A-like superfamily)
MAAAAASPPPLPPLPPAGTVLAAPAFAGGDADACVAPLAWFCAPTVPPRAAGGVLTVSPAAKTDFWSNTFYGFPDPQPHNGHVAFVEVVGDFVCSVSVTARPRARYDQAGLMVLVPGSTGDWLKASVEFIPDGPSHLGSVVTNGAFSDWATQDIELQRDAAGAAFSAFDFRLRRLGCDYIVESRPGGAGHAPWSQIRMAHLHADRVGAPVRVGLYACSPIGVEAAAAAGTGGEAAPDAPPFTAEFTGFTVVSGRL